MCVRQYSSDVIIRVTQITQITHCLSNHTIDQSERRGHASLSHAESHAGSGVLRAEPILYLGITFLRRESSEHRPTRPRRSHKVECYAASVISRLMSFLRLESSEHAPTHSVAEIIQGRVTCARAASVLIHADGRSLIYATTFARRQKLFAFSAACCAYTLPIELQPHSVTR